MNWKYSVWASWITNGGGKLSVQCVIYAMISQIFLKGKVENFNGGLAIREKSRSKFGAQEHLACLQIPSVVWQEHDRSTPIGTE